MVKEPFGMNNWCSELLEHISANQNNTVHMSLKKSSLNTLLHTSLGWARNQRSPLTGRSTGKRSMPIPRRIH